MIRRSKHIHALFVFGFTTAVMFAAIGQARSQTASPEAGKTVRVAKPTGMKLLRRNQLRAKPGFVFERGFNNQLMARPVGGGGLGSSANCSCSKEGNCDWSASGGVAICHQSTNLPCNGSCEWGFTAGGFSGGFIAR
jgi:hypothetical protein